MKQPLDKAIVSRRKFDDLVVGDPWISAVPDKVIEQSPEPLSKRQQSELHYFINEVAKYLYGREQEVLEDLTRCWPFYSEANPAWLAAAEREFQNYDGGDLAASPEQRRRAFQALSKCLQAKTPESSKRAFKLLRYDKNLDRMVRI